MIAPYAHDELEAMLTDLTTDLVERKASCGTTVRASRSSASNRREYASR